MMNDINRIWEALSFVPANEREVWLKMAMAIKSGMGELGFDAWDEWSRQDATYNARDALRTWKSIRPDGKITLGTLFHEARTNGWQDREVYHRPTKEEITERKRMITERTLKEEEKIKVERAKTALMANKIWDEAIEVKIDHPYLIRKRTEPVPTMKEIDADKAASILGYIPKSRDEPLEGRLLVIPVKIREVFSTIELIDGKGRKAALVGKGSKAGGYWASQKLPNSDEKDLIFLIGEGVITVLSAEEATGYRGIAALSSGNLLLVSKALRELYPTALLIILADLIRTTGEPDPHANKASQAVDGFLAIPDFGSHRAHDNKDFNDMKLVMGCDAVRQAILKAQTQQNSVDHNTKITIDDKYKKSAEVVRACDVIPEAISWIWNGWLAAGKMHILAGAPGTGKTTISISLAATITCGGRWPDLTPCDEGNIVIWSGEDDPADTLTPRLIMSGADLSRAYFITGIREGNTRRSFDPAIDMEPLQKLLAEIGDVRLLIIDPIVSAIVGDSHKNAEVRRGLQPLVDLATTMRFALLGITHFSKGTGGREPVERLTGSLAFGALARIVLVAAKQQKDSEVRIFLRAKSNIGSDSGGFEYEIKQGQLQDYPGVYTSAVSWGKNVEGSARDLLNHAESTDVDSKESAVSEAETFLSELLAERSLPMKSVKDEASGAGYSWASIQRAKRSLGVKSIKEGGGFGDNKQQWIWQLSTQGAWDENTILSEDQLKVFNNSEDAQ
jgi:putative DNA primase/helicase